ncbi:MAG: hypothetical protein COC01_05080 [Bacteroidetes bacterium]|nr:T9SS type A sorting domain-containing protein [Bacteroidia bacterium]PCH67730.1 MAG: hypothetical protein COC01_05080 [Bacteroidota bacterium]
MKNIIGLVALLFTFILNTSAETKTWTLLATDAENDVFDVNLLDGKALYYNYDGQTDSLHFRVEVFDSIKTTNFGFTIVFFIQDTSLNQSKYWCQNTSFTFNKFIISWMEDKDNGMIGMGDAKGYTDLMNTSNFDLITNLKDDNAVLSFLSDSNSYILSVARKDVLPVLTDSFKVIATVGSNMSCNDDIPGTDFGSATLQYPSSIRLLTKEENISIYPNPAKSNFTIQLSGIQQPCTDQEIVMTNMYGQEVYRKQLDLHSSNEKVEIALDENLSKGVYSLSFKPCQHNLPTKRVIVN